MDRDDRPTIPPPPAAVEVLRHEREASDAAATLVAEREAMAVVRAQAAVAELLFDVLQEAMRQGTDLPEGFVVRAAAVIGRRSRGLLRGVVRACAVARGELPAEEDEEAEAP